MIEKIYPLPSMTEFKTMSILMVEDDDIDATTLKRALQKMKLVNPLYRAKDGIEALELIRAHAIEPPYIILLDLNMPRMNGIEFLQELRSDPELTHTIVFVLTTSKSDEDILAAYKEHVAGYLVKQHIDNDFFQALGLLDHYWRVVEIPNRI